MTRMLITQEQRKTAHAMRIAGEPWQEVEIATGVCWQSLRKNLKLNGLEMQGKGAKNPVGKLAAPSHEIRFHVMRLGNRKNVAQLYGCGYVTVYQALPLQDIDLYARGQMVSIGGILAKKCLKCGTARELERFWSAPSAASGCRETCDSCRIKASQEKYGIH